jgi:hypothetical protein
MIMCNFMVFARYCLQCFDALDNFLFDHAAPEVVDHPSLKRHILISMMAPTAVVLKDRYEEPTAEAM